MIIFRCDSSFEIGSGHIYRSVNLAHRLRRLGFECVFICLDFLGSVHSVIEKNGFKVILMSEQAAEDEQVSRIKSLKPDWVVIDHYGLSAHFERQIYTFSKVFIIDDRDLRPHYCHVILDNNFRSSYEQLYAETTPDNTIRLLGPSNALLKKEVEEKVIKKEFDLSAPKVLVFFGGTDYSGELIKFYKACVVHTQVLEGKVTFLLVATSTHSHLSQVRELQNTHHIKIHIDPPDWIEKLIECDFYIGSSGTVTWERLYLGLPGALVVVADNQVEIAQELSKTGISDYYGSVLDIDYNDVINRVIYKLKSPDQLKIMSIQGQKLVRPIADEILIQIFRSERNET